MSAVAVKTSRRFDMAGPHGPKDTIPGVIGATKYDSHAKSLGGLVRNTKAHGGVPVVSEKVAEKHNTERHILGPASRTHVPGIHFSMVPFVGHFMSAVGNRL